MYCRTLLTRIACERSVKQQRSSVLSPAQLMASTSFIYRAQKGCYHGDNSSYGRQDQSGSLEANDHSNQRGLLQAHLRHLFFPQLLEPADHKESQSEPSTGGFPPPTAVTRQMCVKCDEDHQDEVRPRRVDVSYIKRRKSETVPVQFSPEGGPHHGRYPGKGGEGQEACIVHRVGPTGGNNTTSTPEHQGNYTRINVKMPTVMRRSGRVSTP